MTFKRGQIVKESSELGVILQSGPVSYDVVWEGGGTSRYRYATGRHVTLATAFELEGQEIVIAHLKREAASARAERRAGAGIKRGQVWPSR